MSAATVLSLRDIGLGSGPDLRLQGIDLDLRGGEILAVLGPNGAGKSSLLGVISGSLPADNGVMLQPSWPSAPDAIWLARHRAVLPQQSSLNFSFQVSDVVALARTPHATGQARDEQIVAEVLAALDITPLAHRDYTQLSGGERQRVQLARVLAQVWQPADDGYPRLLLLDEPTTALDLAHQQQLMTVLRAQCDASLAVVMVLHDVNLAAAWADRLLCLKHGRIVRVGNAEQVLTQDTIKQVFDSEGVVVKHPVSGKPVWLHG